MEIQRLMFATPYMWSSVLFLITCSSPAVSGRDDNLASRDQPPISPQIFCSLAVFFTLTSPISRTRGPRLGFPLTAPSLTLYLLREVAALVLELVGVWQNREIRYAHTSQQRERRVIDFRDTNPQLPLALLPLTTSNVVTLWL